MEPENTLPVPDALVSVTPTPPELMIVPPVPGRGLMLVMRSTTWLVPKRSSVPPLTIKLSAVGMVPVGWSRIVLFPAFSLSVPPLMVVPFVPAVPV